MDMVLDTEICALLADEVRECGRYAKSIQHSVRRNYKYDGTVITDADMEISRRIVGLLTERLPEANIICEEISTPWREEAPYSFVLDPIDGTDMYSQGFPSWAVALGMMDKVRKPVGAWISAPRWGLGVDELFVRLDPGGTPFVNDEPLALIGDKDAVAQVMVSSKGQSNLDFSHFSGKVRTVGSSIIHLISPVIYPNIEACVNQRAYIWDMCASHAVLLSMGMDINYSDGSPFLYNDEFVTKRKPYSMPIYAGTAHARAWLQSNLPVTCHNW
ncbi:inositol monophosphatase family protein [Parasphaerochaeta coccoides]|uniref:Inositol monophosphatase n=1 Tax=Parasphaerochaeta coccoides (strain ATCC BAA-1237 / DSM 17374 / SPN1) TaxID=760011 RepID=F4GKZ0_PARC1|nr:inositol monophosphatase family protein [Parasphaerochaeta coccoides]AEC01903.1 inositol monophosphatase [Parasphaerochaeta coccoides DSM 17374]